jgi:ribosomal protein L11 methylase PrmA
MVPLWVWPLLLIIATVIAIYFMLGSFAFGAGYQPTPPSVVRRMMAVARIGPKDRVYDLGAGTGTLLFRALDEGAASVVGVEIEPLRFLWLRFRRWRAPLGRRVELRRENIFRTEIKSADVVLVFLWPGAMRRLSERFREELRPGSRIISYWHPLKDWKAQTSDPKLRVYSYEVPGRS